MSILVLLETELVRTSAVGATTDYVEGVRAVHAARQAPESPEDPGDATLCGTGTGRMRRDPYRAPGADAPWYPPEWSTRVCPYCDRAVRA